MGWEYIEYKYPNANEFDKELVWVSTTCNIYFAFKRYIASDWEWFAGDASHDLGTGRILIGYASESSASANYVTTDQDSDGKFVCLLPAAKRYKYARMYIDDSASPHIYEWQPGTRKTAHDIVTGEITISDVLATRLNIRVIDTTNNIDRITLGKAENTYGLFGKTDTGATAFELTGSSLLFGGWAINSTSLSNASLEIDAKNSYIQSTNYVAGDFGSGFRIDKQELEVANVEARGMIQAGVIEYQTLNTIAGNVFIMDADILAATVDAGDNQIEITGAITLEVNDVIKCQNASQLEWMSITSDLGNNVYAVNRDESSEYETLVTWGRGTTVVNFGQAGDGGILITSSESNYPYLEVFENETGIPWGGLTSRVRLGNLNGLLDYSSTTFGFIAQKDSTHYISLDLIKGLRINGVNIIQPQANAKPSALYGGAVGNFIAIHPLDRVWTTVASGSYITSGAGYDNRYVIARKFSDAAPMANVTNLSDYLVCKVEGKINSWSETGFFTSYTRYMTLDSHLVCVGVGNLTNQNPGYGFEFNGALLGNPWDPVNCTVRVRGNSSNATKHINATVWFPRLNRHSYNAYYEIGAIYDEDTSLIYYYIDGQVAATLPTSHLSTTPVTESIFEAGMKSYWMTGLTIPQPIYFWFYDVYVGKGFYGNTNLGYNTTYDI